MKGSGVNKTKKVGKQFYHIKQIFSETHKYCINASYCHRSRGAAIARASSSVEGTSQRSWVNGRS